MDPAAASSAAAGPQEPIELEDFGKRTVRERLRSMPWGDFWIVFAYLLLSSFAMCYAMNYVDERMPSPERNDVLPDIVQEVWSVPQNSTAWARLQIASNVMFFGNAITCSSMLLWHYRFRILPIFIKWGSVWGTAYLIRIFFMFSTALPPTADIKCRYTIPREKIPNYLLNALLGVATFGNSNVHCGDLFFSGHTILICCSWMAALQHLRHFPAVVVICTVCVFGNMLLLIVCNNHYTMDVITSFYVTCTLWVLHPLKRPAYLDPRWYLSWGEQCTTCWVSETLPDEEESWLLPDVQETEASHVERPPPTV